MTVATEALSELYLEDETAWLEAMAERIQAGELADLDFVHLQEYLTDMAGRDRREVESRLVVLLLHVLKWVAQPDQRSGSWRSTILAQRHELVRLTGRGVLRAHAEAVLHDLYPEAVERASAETSLPTSDFPTECPYSVDELLTFDPVVSE